MPREPRTRSGWKKATWDDLSRALRLEWADHSGYIRCVTCEKSRFHLWDSGEIHAGHYLGGRSESILFMEIGIHPQCRWCNTAGHINYGYGGLRKKETVAQRFDEFMRTQFGEHIIDSLRFMKSQERRHSIDEFRLMRAAYKRRQKVAKEAKGL